jgi:hypothetical protein
MQISLIVLIKVVGVFLALAKPFESALWMWIALFVIGFYLVWRYGKRFREKNEINNDYESVFE